MLKNLIKSLFENVYNSQINPKEYLEKFVSKDYKQIVDGHEIDYIDFIEHIQKQREIIESISLTLYTLLKKKYCSLTT